MSRQDRETAALRAFAEGIATGALNLHGADARAALDKLQRQARKLIAKTKKTPCGECHLKPRETCDICGAAA